MPNFYLVVDLEATCCDRDSIPRNQMETIEIGAVMVDATSLKAIAEFQTFVHPVKHAQLTKFCTELTSITQTEVDSAPRFPAAITAFHQWTLQYPSCLFCSWGKFDQHQLKQDCRSHSVAYPFSSKHFNIKTRFARSQRLQRRVGMLQALELIGSVLEGTQHRGIDDARNIAKLLPYALDVQTIAALQSFYLPEETC